MGRIDLVVAVSANQEKVLNALAREKRLEQTQCRRVGPLQVVEKDHQRMVLARQRADEILEDELEPVERLRGAKSGRRRLLTDDQLDLRDDFGQDAPLRTQARGQSSAPIV